MTTAPKIVPSAATRRCGPRICGSRRAAHSRKATSAAPRVRKPTRASAQAHAKSAVTAATMVAVAYNSNRRIRLILTYGDPPGLGLLGESYRTVWPRAPGRVDFRDRVVRRVTFGTTRPRWLSRCLGSRIPSLRRDRPPYEHHD